MRAMRRAALVLVLAGIAALSGTASAKADMPDDVINELMCPSPSFSQPLATSNTAQAVWMRDFIRAKAAEGWSRQRIVDTLVRQYGERILVVPPKEGFNLAVWITPFATIFGGVAVVGLLLTRWLRERRWHDANLNAEMAGVIDGKDLQHYEAQLLQELDQFE